MVFVAENTPVSPAVHERCRGSTDVCQSRKSDPGILVQSLASVLETLSTAQILSGIASCAVVAGSPSAGLAGDVASGVAFGVAAQRVAVKTLAVDRTPSSRDCRFVVVGVLSAVVLGDALRANQSITQKTVSAH